jgi:vacuolar-type H+-ATPase subunit H
MRSKSKKAQGTGDNSRNKARKTYNEADKQARDEADIKYKETLEQTRKVRDEIMDKAEKAFRDATSKLV